MSIKKAYYNREFLVKNFHEKQRISFIFSHRMNEIVFVSRLGTFFESCNKEQFLKGEKKEKFFDIFDWKWKFGTMQDKYLDTEFVEVSKEKMIDKVERMNNSKIGKENNSMDWIDKEKSRRD